MTALDQVVHHAAATAQVEAGGGRREWWDEQHGRPVGAVPRGWAVTADGALRRLLDDRRGRAREVGDAAAHEHVERVCRGIDELVG